jgi:hypothetical protein
MTSDGSEMDVGQRLAAVLDELGIERAHIAAGGAKRGSAPSARTRG